MSLVKIYSVVNDIKLLFFLDIGVSHNFLSLQDADQPNLSAHTGSIGNIQLANGKSYAEPCTRGNHLVKPNNLYDLKFWIGKHS